MAHHRRVGGLWVVVGDDVLETTGSADAEDDDRYGIRLADAKYVSKGEACGQLRSTREQWARFVHELAHGLPSDNGAAVVARADVVRDYPKRAQLSTHWQVRGLRRYTTGITLGFTDREWSAIRRAAARGRAWWALLGVAAAAPRSLRACTTGSPQAGDRTR